ncbi:DUF4158 domain-containing protein [Streptomyces sp. VB1]|uniref:DUF4158 domain-containing protein n=1 Tax=Streptomyces sp. VB1 TaxID=2986803 RepID=UPI0022425CD4|nr:DUF4158 domain-containing protein [Streptomyces sp. VB1]UZI33205.1 DUF4158 domain-containing protein [Streptomyces sp. VB1]
MEARFPESAKEMPAAAVDYVAQQVKVPAGAWADYDWQGDRIKRHRKEIREAYGFRANTEEDQERLGEWLAAELCPLELSRDRLAEAVVARCRNDHIEPPAPGRVRRLVGKAVKDFGDQFCRSRAPPVTTWARRSNEKMRRVRADGHDDGGHGRSAHEVQNSKPRDR